MQCKTASQDHSSLAPKREIHKGATLLKTSQLTDESITSTHKQQTKDQTRSSSEIPLPFPDGGLQTSLAPKREGLPQSDAHKTQTTNNLWLQTQEIRGGVV